MSSPAPTSGHWQRRLHHPHWPQRLPKALGLTSTNLWDNLATSAARYPDKCAVHYMGAAWSYRQIWTMSQRLAAWLASKGVSTGDRVLLNMQNCPQWLIAHFAILRANAVVVPVNPMNRSTELQHYIVDADAKLAITTTDLAPELVLASQALPGAQQLQHLLVTQHTDGFDAKVKVDFPDQKHGEIGFGKNTHYRSWTGGRCMIGKVPPPMMGSHPY